MSHSTVGVLLPVPAPDGPALDAYRQSLSGLPPETPAHITLVPPTPIANEQWPAVLEHLEAVAGSTRPFDVRIGGTDTFRPVSPVVFVAVADGTAECGVLADRLRAGPLQTPARFPYHPHVTIAHDLPDAVLDEALAEQASFATQWRVNDITLYESATHGWRAVRSFALGQ